MPAAVDGASPTLEVGGNRFYYGQRVLSRAVDEPGPYQNFSQLYESTILSKGEVTSYPNGFTQYTLKGSVNGVSGTYQIGTMPAALADVGRVITHRFFSPGG